MRIFTARCSLVCLLVGCANPPARSVSTSPVAANPACEAVADWRPEVIELPPDFAPTLPAGREELRFAPGMFKPDQSDYFSYVFILALDAAPPSRVAYFEDFMRTYFVGLMTSVAKAKGQPFTPSELGAFDVRLSAADGGFRGPVTLYDAFVTRQRFTLNLTVDVKGSCVWVRASPQSRDHAVWSDLERAAACLPCT